MPNITITIDKQDIIDDIKEIVELNEDEILPGTALEKTKKWIISLVKNRVNQYRMNEARAKASYEAVTNGDIK